MKLTALALLLGGCLLLSTKECQSCLHHCLHAPDLAGVSCELSFLRISQDFLTGPCLGSRYQRKPTEFWPDSQILYLILGPGNQHPSLCCRVIISLLSGNPRWPAWCQLCFCPHNDSQVVSLHAHLCRSEAEGILSLTWVLVPLSIHTMNSLSFWRECCVLAQGWRNNSSTRLQWETEHRPTIYPWPSPPFRFVTSEIRALFSHADSQSHLSLWFQLS